jgi:hypothetical protein
VLTGLRDQNLRFGFISFQLAASDDPDRWLANENPRQVGFRKRVLSGIGEIKAPIGMFGPTRDATSLALSVLADIAASRLVAHA